MASQRPAFVAGQTVAVFTSHEHVGTPRKGVLWSPAPGASWWVTVDGARHPEQVKTRWLAAWNTKWDRR